MNRAPAAGVTPRPPVPRWAWLAVLAVALLARLAVAFAAPRVILWPDGREFDAVAHSLVAHQGYGLQTIRPPGYPTFMALVYWLLGTDLLRLRIVEAVVATVFVGVIGVVGTSLFGARAGLLSALLAALNPVLVLLPSTQYSESLLLLVTSLAFGASFTAWRHGGLWRWALGGALFGLVLLIRPNAVTLLPGVALGFALALRRMRRAWLAPLLVTGLACALAVSPWIVRNYRVHHEWFFVATGGGRSLWLGNNPDFHGASDMNTPFGPVLLAELTHLPDDVARESFLARRSVEFVREHPARAAWLYLLKLRNLFAFFPVTISHTVFLNPWAQACQGIATVLIFAGALISLVRLRSAPALWPLLAGVVTFAFTTAVFFTVMRYRVAIEPCLLWMAGTGWVGLLPGERGAVSASADSGAG